MIEQRKSSVQAGGLSITMQTEEGFAVTLNECLELFEDCLLGMGFRIPVGCQLVIEDVNYGLGDK